MRAHVSAGVLPPADRERRGLRWELVRWRLLFLPLPRWLMPVAVCFESGDGDKFVFDIDAAFRIVGPVVHYHGWLLPKAEIS